VTSSRLHSLSACRNRRMRVGRGDGGSSDGCSSIASRQPSHRRFCRRSQLSKRASQRKQVVGPAYEVGVGGFCLRLPRRIDVLSAEGYTVVWMGHSSALPYYRPAPLTTEGYALLAR
jgi:hypothetical protein